MSQIPSPAFGRPLDTSEEAWAKVQEIHRQLGPEGRVKAAFDAAELIREAILAGLRIEHPEYDEARLHVELLRRLYGDKIADGVARLTSTGNADSQAGRRGSKRGDLLG